MHAAMAQKPEDAATAGLCLYSGGTRERSETLRMYLETRSWQRHALQKQCAGVYAPVRTLRRIRGTCFRMSILQGRQRTDSTAMARTTTLARQASRLWAHRKSVGQNSFQLSSVQPSDCSRVSTGTALYTHSCCSREYIVSSSKDILTAPARGMGRRDLLCEPGRARGGRASFRRIRRPE